MNLPSIELFSIPALIVAAVLELLAILGILYLIATAPVVIEGGVHDANPQVPPRPDLRAVPDEPRHLRVVPAPPTLIDAEALGWLEGAS